MYRTQYDRKEWPPASHAPDVRAPATTFGNVAAATPAPITRAEVLTLIQSQTSGADHPKKGNCHKCGKPGHWANKCPENANSNRRNVASGGNRNGPERTHKPKLWRSTPPAAGAANSKKVKDKTYNCCEKCRRSTTTHTTNTHTGGKPPTAPAATPSANLSTLAPDPSEATPNCCSTL